MNYQSAKTLEKQSTQDLNNNSDGDYFYYTNYNFFKEKTDIQKESSQQMNQNSWAKLTSINSSIAQSYYLHEDIISIGRNSQNTIDIPDNRLSGFHCQIIRKISQENPIQYEYFVKDLSTNGTFVNENKIGKNEQINIYNGDIIYLLHVSKVKSQDVIGFIMTFVDQTVKKTDNEINIYKEELNKKKKLEDDFNDSMRCCICIDIIHQCVTLIDCLHNFCGGCYSEWMKKSKECPQCKKEVLAVKKNANINSLIQNYLETNPQHRRDQKELEDLDKKNIITHDVENLKELKKKLNKQSNQNIDNSENDTDSYISNSSSNKSDSENDSESQRTNRQQFNNLNYKYCRECNIPRIDDQFQCQKDQLHVACLNCNQMMPVRPEKKNIQQCIICKGNYCTQYFGQCIGLFNRNAQLMTLEKQNIPSQLDIQIFRQNQFEFNLIQKYFLDQKITTQNVFNFIMNEQINKGEFYYESTKQFIPDFQNSFQQEQKIVLSKESPICTKCFNNVWFQIVFKYLKANKQNLPDEQKNRNPCWYGINCRTMQHNVDHAKKLNHLIEQQKF